MSPVHKASPWVTVKRCFMFPRRVYTERYETQELASRNIHKQFPLKKQTPKDTAPSCFQRAWVKGGKAVRCREPLAINILSSSLALGGASATTLIAPGDLLNAVRSHHTSRKRHLAVCR
jgi:hypothetical protein